MGRVSPATATVLLPEDLGVEQFVNADLIAAGLSPFAPERSAIQAGRLMLQRIRDLRRRHESFAFETTLAARNYAQADGYLVHILFIWLSSVELACSRVAARVQQGGHNVSTEVVERRYRRGLKNFFRLYQPLANTWTLCDNSSEEPIIVARGGKGTEPTVYVPEVFKRVCQDAADQSA